MKKRCGNCIYFPKTQKHCLAPFPFLDVEEIGYPIGHLNAKQIEYFTDAGHPLTKKNDEYYIEFCDDWQSNFEGIMKEIIEEEDRKRICED